ncbi:hypothetical protein GGI21_005267 [Coemansia aciculifera]|nr:hypothetical protein GGI21_005267 [Coemansia aciculifera]
MPPFEKSSERRRAPSQAMGLDTRIQSSYRGKIIKQRIERNQISKIKRKFYKSEDSGAAEPSTEAAASSSETRGGKSGSKAWQSQRANPYQKLLRERDAARQRNEDERKQRELAISEAEAGRAKYLQQRKSQQKKHTAKNARGQPALSKQIGGLLQKIKNDK